MGDPTINFFKDVSAFRDAATLCKNNGKGDAAVAENFVDEKAARDENADKISSIAQLEAEFDGEFVDFFEDEFHEEKTDAIDFEEFRYCIIAAIEKDKKFTKIWVKDSAQKSAATVYCYDFW